MPQAIGQFLLGLLAISVILAIAQAIAYLVLFAIAFLIWAAPIGYYVYDFDTESIEWVKVREVITFHGFVAIAGVFCAILIDSYAPHMRDIIVEPTQVKALFYSAFIFVFSFGFAAYFLSEIFPWKSKAPVFNGFLAFLSAFFLSAFTALIVFDGKTTADSATAAASRLSDLASTALSIMFLMMAIFLFWKKIKAYF